MSAYTFDAAAQATSWIRPNRAKRSTAFFDYAAGRGVTDDGRILKTRKHPSVSAFLSEIDLYPVDQVFWLGNWPKDVTAWLYGDLPKNWTHGDHWAAGINRTPVYRFKKSGARKLEILHASEWFGNQRPAPEVAAAAWSVLRESIAKEFGGFEIKNRPSSTGLHLWRSSIPFGVEWPGLSVEHQELIRSTSTQARIQSFLPHAAPLAGFWEVDQRWAYAAVCRGLAAGPGVLSKPADVTHADFFPKRGQFAFAPVWCKVTFSAPPDWTGIGLITVKGPERNSWPTTGHTWAGGFELTQAAAFGWLFRVHEMLTLTRKKGGPLDQWAGRPDRPGGLIRAEKRASEHENPEIGALASKGIKAILRNTIGGFFRSGATVQKTVHRDELKNNPDIIPAHAGRPIRKGDWFCWTEKIEANSSGSQHPEFSIQIWDRARRAITLAALDCDPKTILGIATDAIYCAEPMPWFEDRGRAGDFQQVGFHAAPSDDWRPRNLPELREAVK